MVFEMKMELRIEGKVIVIEAEGAVTVQILEEKELECPVEEKEVVTSVKKQEAAPQSLQKKVVENVPAESDDLYSKLVELRRELSVAGNVPPYVIFKDKTLIEMVEKRPADLAAFGNISGVGKSKLEKYGEIFLSVIKGVEA